MVIGIMFLFVKCEVVVIVFDVEMGLSVCIVMSD